MLLFGLIYQGPPSINPKLIKSQRACASRRCLSWSALQKVAVRRFRTIKHGLFGLFYPGVMESHQFYACETATSPKRRALHRMYASPRLSRSLTAASQIPPRRALASQGHPIIPFFDSSVVRTVVHDVPWGLEPRIGGSLVCLVCVRHANPDS